MFLRFLKLFAYTFLSLLGVIALMLAIVAIKNPIVTIILTAALVSAIASFCYTYC